MFHLVDSTTCTNNTTATTTGGTSPIDQLIKLISTASSTTTGFNSGQN